MPDVRDLALARLFLRGVRETRKGRSENRKKNRKKPSAISSRLEKLTQETGTLRLER